MNNQNQLSDVPVRFIYNSKLGMTFGYQIYKGIVLGSVSFAHKPSPYGSRKTKPEMFSRKHGRAITAGRVEALKCFVDGVSSSDRLKTCLIVKKQAPIPNDTATRRKIEEGIYNQLDSIIASHPDYNYYHAHENQIQNEYISGVITEAIKDATK